MSYYGPPNQMYGHHHHHPFNAAAGGFTEYKRVRNGFGGVGDLMHGDLSGAAGHGAKYWGWGKAHDHIRHHGHYGQPYPGMGRY